MEQDERDEELSGGCVRIFLVEDNPDHVFIALTVMRQVLGDAIEMLHAQTAEEALDMITQFSDYDRPDLFLVDLRLPDNGGFSVLTAVRQSDVCSRVPLFVVTSSLYDRDIVESYQLGASAVLSKPLSRAKLREELTRVGAIPPVPGEMVQTTYRH
jgi:chemotaxis family two-component system response regulator Rcp1